MCTSTLRAWKTGRGPLTFRSPNKIVTGKHKIAALMEYEIPCGQCVECRIAQARDWAVRIVHEMQIEHELNGRGSAMVTLTYNDDCVPYVYEEIDGKEIKTDRMTLRKDHIKKFIGRLREKKRRRGRTDIRYYAAGEYGDEEWRPHYHCILIGCDFPDMYLYSKSDSGNDIYRSDFLEGIWQYGNSSITETNFTSAEYTAKDIVKRVKESQTEEHKKWLKKHGVSSIDEYYGGRVREFQLKSTKPGIGARWIDKYYRDVFPHCQLPKINGVNLPVPRYYVDRIIKKEKAESGLLLDYSLTKKQIGRRMITNRKKRRDDYEDRMIDRNEIKKKRRKTYNEFKEQNRTIFGV